MKLKKILLGTLLFLLLTPVVIVLVALAPYFWKGWTEYSKLDQAVAAIAQTRKEPPRYIHVDCNRGAFHMHSYWSHDSRGTIEDLTEGAHNAGYKFLFLTDHSHGNQDTFPRGIYGMHKGILIEPGTEKNGLCCWPLKSTVVDWTQPVDSVAKTVTEGGGMIYYLHTEEEHNWDCPHYQGMEIYNWHTDILEEKNMLPMLLDFMVNKNRYRHWCYYSVFNEQTDILANWDTQNLKRKIVGIAGQDVHENQNFRAQYREDGQVEWVGPNAKTLTVRRPNWFDRLLLDKENSDKGWAFRYMVDTYTTTFNHCANYLFVNTISVDSIKSAINAGHNFIAFNSLGNAMGFQYFAQNEQGEVSAILGDSVKLSDVAQLRAVSPYPARYILKRNGTVVDEEENVYDYQFKPSQPGNYRLELWFNLAGKPFPWIYTNNIYVNEE